MFKRSSIFAVCLFLLGIVPAVAQTVSCSFLVEQALLAVGDNCADLDRNSACYGYNQVDATFSADYPEDYFSVPSDRANLTDLDTLRTAPMDSATARWGVAVMNIQANLPNTVPGQGVIMMLVGDAEIRNDVPAEEANEIIEPLSTVILEDTHVYTSPSATADILVTASANEIVLVDGFNPTKTWLRVVTDGTIAWIERGRVARLAGMDNLPIVGASYPTPMQAFYLSTGIGESECQEADSMIAVQSPENITVDLTVNGVDIRVGSLVTFQNLAENIINLTVHRGRVTTIFGNSIQAGESAVGVVNSTPEQDGVIIAWGGAIPASKAELMLGQTAQIGINSVARHNGWNERSIEPNEPDEPKNEELIHIVSSGETLFGIGRQYEASLPAIVERNALSAPYTLFAEQELVIPNPGSGFVGLPSSNDTVVQPSISTETSIGTCNTLRLTSPLDTAPAEAVPYYWDGVAGATQYQVNIYDQATGGLMGTLYTEGAETTLTISAGQLGVGGAMLWEVIALQNGQVLCSTGLSQPLIHSAPVSPATEIPQKAGFSIDWSCGSNVLKVSWKNAEDNEKITFKIKDGLNTYSRTQRGAKGNFTVQSAGYNFISVDADTASGESDSKMGDKYCP
jgi:LysM repeat protein